jgi:glyoxylase-like metal-dependent hydrolase (beta-lactamase superfamily II)
MRRIAEGVYLLEGLRAVNVYALVSDGAVTLIDSGMQGAADTIAQQLSEQELDLSMVRYLVATHAHGDHVGCLAELARRSGGQVVAHREEVPYIEQGLSFPSASPFKRMFNWFGDRILTREPCPVGRPVEDGDVLDFFGGFQVVHTPGHSPGSICLYLKDSRILFCGDLLFNRHPLTGRKGLRYSLAVVSQDVVQARESVGRLLDLQIETLCPGHGEPILKDAGSRIRTLESRTAG